MLRRLGLTLREIIAPSSMPDPPGMFPEAGRKLPLQQHIEVWGFAFREYLGSWRTAGPSEAPEQPTSGAGELTENLVGVARNGAEGLKPYLQKIYQARAEAYRDAVTHFVKGYREGVSQAKENDLFEPGESREGNAWEATPPRQQEKDGFK